jgi:hypothetical protein
MDEIKRFRITIAGNKLLMHNGQLADPLNTYTKQLKEMTSKRKKSDDDHEKIAEIEFQGGLYFDDGAGPFIPADALDAVITKGATKKRLGTVVQACVRTAEDINPLQYETFGAKGARTRDGLWKEPRFRDRRGCGVQKSRVIRTRPKFTNWSVTFEIDVVPSELNAKDIKQAIIDAGVYVGLCDFRPRFGLFTLKEFEEITS